MTRHIKRFDHIGVTVTDLDAATDFFTRLGLEVEGRQRVEGHFIDTVTGLADARTEVVMLACPEGGRVELSCFERPEAVPGPRAPMANELGLRSLAFQVGDLRAVVDELADAGHRLVGDIGEYEGAWAMAYVRGPEGIIVALAQQLD